MKYISMLRGINVSGQKVIKMTDLMSLYESLGFKNVVTYIQSGNVIFETPTKTQNKLKGQLEKAIRRKYNFHVPVVIRTKSEMNKIVINIPFNKLNPTEDGTKVLITFLSQKPNEINLSTIQQYVKSPEKLIVIDKEVYLHCPNGYGKSKLTNIFLEKKLEVEATTRNWKSVIKLNEL
ncbi:MAG: DUF1697 domain-containing protein [Nitrospinales bacterium]